jgi:hypothetical protein
VTEQASLKMSHVVPIIELISAFSNNFDTLRDFMKGLENLNENFFPMKVIIPLFLSINVIIEFDNIKVQSP